MKHGTLVICPEKEECRAKHICPHAKLHKSGTLGRHDCAKQPCWVRDVPCEEYNPIGEANDVLNAGGIMAKVVFDECWTCGELLKPEDLIVEIQVRRVQKGGESLEAGTQPYHRAHIRCSKDIPGINEDNLEACIDGDWREQWD